MNALINVLPSLYSLDSHRKGVLMDGSSLLKMNLRSERGSTSSGAANEGHGDSAQAFERGNEGAQEVPPLVPHPFLPPPPPQARQNPAVPISCAKKRQENQRRISKNRGKNQERTGTNQENGGNWEP